MKSLKSMLAVIAASAVMSSCSFFDGRQAEVEYMPVKLDGSKSWSLLNAKGEVIFEDEFKNKPSCVVEGLFSVEEGDGYTVYQVGDKPKVLGDLEKLKGVGYVSEGLLGIVRPHERISFVDKSGNPKFTLEPVNGKEITESDINFSDGLLYFGTEENKYGFVDTKGKVVVSPVYDGVVHFNEGHAIVVKNSENSEGDTNSVYYILNTKGEEVAKLKSDFQLTSLVFKDGVVTAREGDSDGRYGFINTKGEFTRLPAKVRNIVDYTSKVIVYGNEDGDKGIMTRDGEDLVRPKYNNIYIIDDDRFVVEKDDKYSLINRDGEKIENKLDDYKRVIPINNSGFEMMVMEGSIMMLTDFTGKRIGKLEFKDADFNLASSYSLHSDYFNTNSLVTAMVSQVNADGIGKYKLGDAPSKYLKNAEDYTYSSQFQADPQPEGGYRFSLSESIDCSGAIASSQFYYNDYYDYGYTYNFNPGVTISSVWIYASTEVSDIWKEAKPIFIEQLKSKGFKVENETEYGVVMNNGNVNVSVNQDGSYGIRLAASKKALEAAQSSGDDMDEQFMDYDYEELAE